MGCNRDIKMKKHQKYIIVIFLVLYSLSVWIWETKAEACYYGFYFQVTHRYTGYYCVTGDKVWNGDGWRNPSPHEQKQINKIILY